MLRRNVPLLSIVLGLSSLAAVDAAASAQRTFVASYGVPANTAFNCSIANPCRAFSEAIGVTNAGGEVIVLDSAGYGPVTITKSVSIVAPAGIYAGISVFSGNGVTIVTPAVTDRVVLQGLTINNQNSAGAGIFFVGAGTLEVGRVRIAGFAGNVGLHFLPLPAGQGRLHAVDLSVSTTFRGVRIAGGLSASDTVHAVLQRVDLTGNEIGLAAVDFASVVATDSTFTENGLGIGADASSGRVTLIAIDRSTVSRNLSDGISLGGPGATYATITGSTVANNDGTGLSVGAGAQARLAGTTIAQNLQGTGGTGPVQSQGNNFILGT